MVAIYRTMGLDVSRTPKVGKKRSRLTYDKELTKTLKHLRYKGNTIIEKRATLIHGIGVISWESRDCILGPCMGWFAEYNENDMHAENPIRNLDYRSILAHFKRDGEVLYNLWPTPECGGVKQSV